VIVVALVVLVGMAVITVAVGLAIGHRATRGLVALTVVVGLAVILVTAMGGLGVRHDQDDDDTERATAPAERAPSTGPAPLQDPTVRLVATSADALPSLPRSIGEVESGSVIIMSLSGLEAGSDATVHQCRAGTLDPTDCRAGLPVTVDDDGRATVAVDVERRFDLGRVGDDEVDCVREECSVVVFGTSRLEIVTVFDRPAPPPPTVQADPVALPPGGVLTAVATGLPAGAEVAFVVCRPGGDGDADCGPPTERVRADREGRATAPVTVNPGRCPRGTTCAVAVVVEDGGPRAFARLHLIGRSGAAYDDGRVAVGLGLAGLLLALAIVLLRVTDWTPVGGDPFAGIDVPEDPFADVDRP
jgi:hypothetical protein